LLLFAVNVGMMTRMVSRHASDAGKMNFFTVLKVFRCYWINALCVKILPNNRTTKL
jgi:hypothetical protein